MRNKAFSLVELSIVLVIIGLVTGGIISGQTLIRASELRSVISDVDKFRTGAQGFRDKFLALPGDYTDATTMWGAADPTPATCIVTAGTGTQTCNGDGDGIIRPMTFLVANNYSEVFLFWQHLSNAGLIPGSYTGRQATATSLSSVAGSNVPTSKVAKGAYLDHYLGTITSGTSYYYGDYGHTIYFGIISTYANQPVIKPDEAWTIDKKIDDGSPAFGNVRTYTPTVSGSANCATSSTASLAEYNVTYTSLGCMLMFTNLY